MKEGEIMAQYKVINRFAEKNHNNHIYEVGENYPTPGQKLVKTRADFLTKVHPEYDVAFLEEINEKKPTKENVGDEKWHC